VNRGTPTDAVFYLLIPHACGGEPRGLAEHLCAGINSPRLWGLSNDNYNYPLRTIRSTH